ncbi:MULTISPECIES: YmfQ family protein [Brenneria]|uniref:DUF2313 domain-containing protein n=1 Tax=Brenneria nigrifluens DSM 30175 = ATCC 13028 TaxID=1121120 RepID=A0A2U1USS3_9GAMM|nr:MULTISPECIES: putative phage tail protein [Brenneria]EHD21563.1 Protein of unknown function DUF2313 [Brenneria sp. EniD312]PWC24651.1 DUF2313 domain-containing protein [Brenneria nigrifluens DSM 30175 = ATCC 13028]QCR04683.1 DUF2313 domain-containing protein [Brenneria nigrifluens DSM 30175 = ATCC 13028]
MSTVYKTLLGLLLPSPYATKEERLAAELNAEANALELSNELASTVLNGVTPLFAQGLLQDWERVLGLAPSSDSSYQQRLDNVLIKIAETGGLSIPYFTRLASRLGYKIAIEELQPFRAGVSRCGQSILQEDFIWAWRVNVSGSAVKKYYFTTGISLIGERLMTFGDSIIESVFNDLKPAHTYCYFAYQES